MSRLRKLLRAGQHGTTTVEQDPGWCGEAKAVAALDSDAKAEGTDVVFIGCSDARGKKVPTAFADELSHGLTIR